MEATTHHHQKPNHTWNGNGYSSDNPTKQKEINFAVYNTIRGNQRVNYLSKTLANTKGLLIFSERWYTKSASLQSPETFLLASFFCTQINYDLLMQWLQSTAKKKPGPQIVAYSWYTAPCQRTIPCCPQMHIFTEYIICIYNIIKCRTIFKTMLIFVAMSLC